MVDTDSRARGRGDVGQGLSEAIASLATYPERCPVADEDDLYWHGTVRMRLFRPKHGRQAWRILFTVREAAEGDPPMVRVLLVRHGAQAPLTEWPNEEEGA